MTKPDRAFFNRRSAPEGALENTPARQCWEAVADDPKVPEGRQKFGS
ncbi:MAG: hypothetical protein FLDDKLPJ_00028 [Phycisphaerae bacterium]|nr:hypothetical protein [Phycisphaerae bacterium]